MDLLPPELIIKITKNLPCVDICQLRATNRRFNAIAYPVAFHEVTVVNTLRSVQRLRTLLLHPEIRETIRSVKFVETEVGATAAADTEQLYESIKDTFSHFCFAPRLERLSLAFHESAASRLTDLLDWLSQIDLQWTVIGALEAALARAEAPHPFPTIRHLSIVGLLPRLRRTWRSESMRLLYASLVSLTIEIVCVSPQEGYFVTLTTGFLMDVLVHHILLPSTSLQELNLKMTVAQGYDPPCLFLDTKKQSS